MHRVALAATSRGLWLWVVATLAPVSTGIAAEFTCANTACLSLAVLAANSTPEPDTINLQRGTYTIIAPAGNLFGSTGLPVVTSPILIRGNASTIQRSPALSCDLSSQPGPFRLFGVIGNGKLTLQDLTLTLGCINGDGGALLNSGGTVELMRVTVVRNTAADSGGGVASIGGSLLAISSTFSSNSATAAGSRGGGLFVASGQATLNLAVFERNTAISGGGIASGDHADITFNGRVRRNGAVFGGGFHLEEGSTLRISLSEVTSNTARVGGGGLTLWESVLEMTSTTVRDNSTDFGGNGGGAHFHGLLEAARSLIKDSTFDLNRATLGGGIMASGFFAPELEIVNSTLSANRAVHGGGVWTERESVVLLTNVTLAGNTASGVADAVAVVDRATVRLANTIIGKTDSTPTRSCSSGTSGLVSFGYNLAEDTSCRLASPGDQEAVSAGLLPFVDTGRPGGGHFPLGIGSLARDAGDVARCASRPELQRDQLRQLRDDRCDVGSIELIAPTILP